MKYYAVTDDPNELLHYGRLGMKWGEHIFVGPKSLAYKNAARKLKTSSNIRNKVEKFKSVVNKTRQQIAANHQRTQQNKYNNAVAKAQKRLSALEGMNNLDKLTSYERAMEHQIKNDAFTAKTEAKQMRFAEKMDRKYAKNERKMDKYTQLAREGRLAYGKLSEDQVNRITNRLAIEQNARRLGSTEKPKFRTRLKEAAQEGILQGVIQGTAAGMKEIAIDKVQNRLRNKRILDKANRNEAERIKEANRIKNSRTRREIRQDKAQEAYEAQIDAGTGILERSRVLHPFQNLNSGKAIQRANLRKQINQLKLESDTKEGSIGSELQALKDKKLRLEADTNVKKKIYEADANNRISDSDRLKIESYEDNQRERKRQQELQTKLRNDEDEAWNKYVREGGTTTLYDPKSNSLINLNDAKRNTDTYTREQRKQAMAAQERAEKAKEEAAYNKRTKEEVRRIKQEQYDKAVDDADKRYERAMKKYQEDKKADDEAIADYNQKVKEEKAKNGWNPGYKSNITAPKLHNTPKPNQNDYTVNKSTFKYDVPKIETYDERKTLIELGMPTYFPYEKKNGNKGGNKGGNRK